MPEPAASLFVGRRFRVESVSYADAQGRPHERQVIRHPGAVVVLPLVAPDRVCLIRNYRVAAGGELIEAPAGTLEPGEDPAVTARRELEEETGYRAASWRELPPFFLSPGILDELMRCFLAWDLTPGEPEREAGEEIENLVVSLDEALAMADDGRIRDSKTLVALYRYQRWRGG